MTSEHNVLLGEHNLLYFLFFRWKDNRESWIFLSLKQSYMHISWAEKLKVFTF